MKSFTLKQYRDSGCYVLTGGNMDDTLVSGYNGKICEAKCRFYDNGKCDAFLKMAAIAPASLTTVLATNPVKKEAKRLGISISDARKQRAGTSTTVKTKVVTVAKAVTKPVAKKSVTTGKVVPKSTPLTKVTPVKPAPKAKTVNTNGTFVKGNTPKPKVEVKKVIAPAVVKKPTPKVKK
jgi:dsDNA-binding SOS-regulon protein